MKAFRTKNGRILNDWQNHLDSAIQTDPNNREFIQSLKQNADVPFTLMQLAYCHLQQVKLAGAEEKQHLEEAEKALLKIAKHMGNEGNQTLLLAKTYFLLGENSKGQSALDQYEKTFQEEPKKLLSLVQLLRDLGRTGKARTGSQDLYHHRGPRGETEIAYTMAHLVEDLENKIQWLEKANQESIVSLNLKSVEESWHCHRTKKPGVDLTQAIAELMNAGESANLLNQAAPPMENISDY